MALNQEQVKREATLKQAFDDIVEAFTDIVQAFNNASDEKPAVAKKHETKLKARLDENALVYSINRHKRYHPKEQAMCYLKAQFADHPHFGAPTDTRIVINNSCDEATITGTTTWIDDKNTRGEPLEFNFTCAKKNSKWLFCKLWAR
jgi:hypothetical protein